MSPGCASCYAEALSKRNPAIFGKWGDKGTRVVASEAMWKEPLKWNNESELYKWGADRVGKPPRRHRVFCASVADVFEDWKGPMLNAKREQLFWSHSREPHESIYHWIGSPDCAGDEESVTMGDVRDRLFALIDATATPNLDWLLLTKRPENILGLSMWRIHPSGIHQEGMSFAEAYRRDNTWLGTTVENQEQADKRIPHLLKCSDLSPVLWLSVEPMLAPVDLSEYLIGSSELIVKWCCDQFRPSDDPMFCKCGTGVRHHQKGLTDSTLDWVVCGCEQGPQHKPLRPMQLDWARSLRDQCQASGVPFFMKQMEVNGRVTDDVNDFPSDLQVREFPKP